MKRILISTFILLFGAQLLAQKKSEINQPKLSKELVNMRHEDQKLRKKWAKMVQAGKTNDEKYEKLTDHLIKTDSSNTERMKEIIDEYGWPTRDMVGNGASSSAWLLVQHADRDPLFQMKCLPLLKKAVDAGQSNPRNYAYLYDRVQIAKGERQLYATQSSTNNGLKEGAFQTIEDESNVQKRRTAMNITQHVEDYAESMDFDYKIPTAEKAIQREKNLFTKYETNLKQAQNAMKNKDYTNAVKYYLIVNEAYGFIQSEDFVETARALSLSKHEDASAAAFYLIKAAIRGYEQIDEFETDKDFEYIKQVSPRNWNNLMRIVKELKT